MNRAFTWLCSKCERFVPNREVFAFKGGHYHWDNNNVLCGPIAAAPLSETDRQCESS